MGVPVKVYVDLSKKVDLPSLSLQERFFTGLRYYITNSKFYKNMAIKAGSKEERRIQKEREEFKMVLNTIINRELNGGRLLVKQGVEGTPKEVSLLIARSQKPILDICLKSGDFLAYDVKIKQESRDILRAFSTMPLYVTFSKRLVHDKKND